MNLRQVLFTALNHESLEGVAISRQSVDADAIEVFNANGVDIDEVLAEVEAIEDDY